MTESSEQRAPEHVTIDLTYLGPLRAKMGCAEETVEVAQPATVRSVLDELARIHGDDVGGLFFNQYGWQDPRLICLVASKDGPTEVGLDSSLADRTALSLMLGMPMTAG